MPAPNPPEGLDNGLGNLFGVKHGWGVSCRAVVRTEADQPMLNSEDPPCLGGESATHCPSSLGLISIRGLHSRGLNRRRPVCRPLRPRSRRTGNSVDEVL
jgi:hypothetical protein